MAHGRALVATGEDGFLTTWQLLTSAREPLPPEEEAQLGAACEGCETPPVVSSDSFRIDLDDVAARAGSAYLGATLLVPRDTRLHLLLGFRGGGTVFLDGIRVVTGQSEERFRRDLLLATLPLTTGEHRLVIRFDRPERGAWRGSVRLLGPDFGPGTGHVAVTVGTPDEAQQASLAAASVRVDETHALGESGPEVRVRADLPGGGLRRAVTVRVGDEEATLEPTGGIFDGGHDFVVPMPERGVLRLSAEVGERRNPAGHEPNLGPQRAPCRRALACGDERRARGRPRADDLARRRADPRRPRARRRPGVAEHPAGRRPPHHALAGARPRPLRRPPRLRADGVLLAPRRNGAGVRALRAAGLPPKRPTRLAAGDHPARLRGQRRRLLPQHLRPRP